MARKFVNDVPGVSHLLFKPKKVRGKMRTEAHCTVTYKLTKRDLRAILCRVMCTEVGVGADGALAVDQENKYTTRAQCDTVARAYLYQYGASCLDWPNNARYVPFGIDQDQFIGAVEAYVDSVLANEYKGIPDA